MADQTVENREIDIDTLVHAVDGKERNKPDPAYEFSSGRTFYDKGEDSALYNKT